MNPIAHRIPVSGAVWGDAVGSGERRNPCEPALSWDANAAQHSHRDRCLQGCVLFEKGGQRW